MRVDIEGTREIKGEELRDILNAVADFLKEIREPLQALIETLLSSFRGDKLGEEVANFYRKLVESGVPKELASRMTERFLEQRMSVIGIVDKFSKWMRREEVRYKEFEREEGDKERE